MSASVDVDLTHKQVAQSGLPGRSGHAATAVEPICTVRLKPSSGQGKVAALRLGMVEGVSSCWQRPIPAVIGEGPEALRDHPRRRATVPKQPPGVWRARPRTRISYANASASEGRPTCPYPTSTRCASRSLPLMRVAAGVNFYAWDSEEAVRGFFTAQMRERVTGMSSPARSPARTGRAGDPAVPLQERGEFPDQRGPGAGTDDRLHRRAPRKDDHGRYRRYLVLLGGTWISSILTLATATVLTNSSEKISEPGSSSRRTTPGAEKSTRTGTGDLSTSAANEASGNCLLRSWLSPVPRHRAAHQAEGQGSVAPGRRQLAALNLAEEEAARRYRGLVRCDVSGTGSAEGVASRQRVQAVRTSLAGRLGPDVDRRSLEHRRAASLRCCSGRAGRSAGTSPSPCGTALPREYRRTTESSATEHRAAELRLTQHRRRIRSGGHQVGGLVPLRVTTGTDPARRVGVELQADDLSACLLRGDARGSVGGRGADTVVWNR